MGSIQFLQRKIICTAALLHNFSLHCFHQKLLVSLTRNGICNLFSHIYFISFYFKQHNKIISISKYVCSCVCISICTSVFAFSWKSFHPLSYSNKMFLQPSNTNDQWYSRWFILKVTRIKAVAKTQGIEIGAANVYGIFIYFILALHICQYYILDCMLFEEHLVLKVEH